MDNEQFNFEYEKRKLLDFTKKFFIILGAILIVILMLLNPNRGMFNNTIIEGGISNYTNDREIQSQIRDINLKDLNDVNHPFVKRRNYVILSIYDVKVSDDKTYHILGILEMFSLLK